jgi:RNA polymerase sigma factor (sigma-70 family)
MTEQGGYQNQLELINRCRNGDRLAQTELYRLYYKAMYNTCYRMLNNQVEAEDVMQESFLSAFLKINSYRGEMSFGSWLKRIVVNKAIDVLRSRKVKFEEINEKYPAEDESEAFRNMVSEETSGLVRRIREAVTLLPEGFRVVLSLSLFEGYDHEEIAMILGISESTSRSQLARAKKKLVDYLNNERNETVR